MDEPAGVDFRFAVGRVEVSPVHFGLNYYREGRRNETPTQARDADPGPRTPGWVAEWLLWYHEERLHDALGTLTPIVAFVGDYPHLRPTHPPPPVRTEHP